MAVMTVGARRRWKEACRSLGAQHSPSPNATHTPHTPHPHHPHTFMSVLSTRSTTSERTNRKSSGGRCERKSAPGDSSVRKPRVFLGGGRGGGAGCVRAQFFWGLERGGALAAAPASKHAHAQRSAAQRGAAHGERHTHSARRGSSGSSSSSAPSARCAFSLTDTSLYVTAASARVFIKKSLLTPGWPTSCTTAASSVASSSSGVRRA